MNGPALGFEAYRDGAIMPGAETSCAEVFSFSGGELQPYKLDGKSPPICEAKASDARLSNEPSADRRAFAMPVQIEFRSDGRAAPLILCDVCGKRITDAMMTNVVFERGGLRTTPKFLHKGACTMAHDQQFGQWPTIEFYTWVMQTIVATGMIAWLKKAIYYGEYGLGDTTEEDGS